MSVRVNFSITIQGKNEWSLMTILPTKENTILQSYAERTVSDIMDGITARLFKLNQVGWENFHSQEFEHTLRNSLSGVYRMSCVSQDTTHKQYPHDKDFVLSLIVTPIPTTLRPVV